MITYIRTYKLTYDAIIENTPRVNSLLSYRNLFSVAKWDSAIEPTNYGIQPVEETITTYHLDFDGVSDCLSFQYNSDCNKVIEQLTTAFPDKHIRRYEQEVTTKSDKEMDMRGQILIDGSMTPSLSGSPCVMLNDDVSLVVKLEAGYRDSSLSFTTYWRAPKVARKAAIERNCVELPLEPMGRIQALVESVLIEAGMSREAIQNATIDCHFDTVSESRSECTPDIIQRVREERMKHGSEEE